MNILIVEDDRDYQSLLVLAHERNQITCDFSFATTAQQTLDLLRQQRPQVLLLDYDLPDSDGITVVKEIRAIPELRSLPILMFSIHNTPELIEKAYVAGINAFIAKPEDYKSLINLWHNLCSFWSTTAILPQTVD